MERVKTETPQTKEASPSPEKLSSGDLKDFLAAAIGGVSEGESWRTTPEAPRRDGAAPQERRTSWPRARPPLRRYAEGRGGRGFS